MSLGRSAPGSIPTEDLLREINTYIPSRPMSGKRKLPDVETFAIVDAVYNDWTVDLSLGKTGTGTEIKGPQYKRVPVLTAVGDAGEGYGEFDLPQVGSIVTVTFVHNRSFPVVRKEGFYASPEIKGQNNEQKNVTKNVRSYFSSTADKGYVHQSGTKWKVKANGDLELVKTDSDIVITISGKTVKVVNKDSEVTIDETNIKLKNSAAELVVTGTEIQLGSGVLEKIIKGSAFKTYFDLHTHPTAATGPPSPPTVPMPVSVLSNRSKTE